MTAHLDRDELVRFRDHGTATERDAVLLHLATCQRCSSKYAELVRTSPVTEGPAHFDPVDFVGRGYAVRGQVARSTLARASSPSWIEALWNPSVPFARLVMTAQLALIVLLTLFVAVPRFREGSFTTLSGPQTS